MPTPWVPRPRRLVLTLLATIIAWLCASIVFISLSLRGIVAEILMYGTFIAFDYFLLLACPLVLLWPVQSQIKHWYAFLGVAALCCVYCL